MLNSIIQSKPVNFESLFQAIKAMTVPRTPAWVWLITAGYRLPAKYVIHTVGPVWDGGDYGEPMLLKSCYEKSFNLMLQYKCKTIAFPSISTGVYGYPIEEAASIAVATVTARLKDTPEIEQVIFCCFSDYDLDIYNEILNGSSLLI